jgi:hypothetical protein
MEAKGRLPRRGLESYYYGRSSPPKRKDQVDSATKAVERLIERGFLTGYGVRTRRKWFIKEVRLTAAGRRLAQAIVSGQQRLPLRGRKFLEH